ncbi:MAG: alpha-2-macroglobulin family protein, partial [Bacteroidota bacterium]
AGTISSRDNIRVVFAAEAATVDEIGKEANRQLFSIRPSVKGALIWVNERTLEFTPAEMLPNGKEFMVSVSLERIYPDIPKSHEDFTFPIQTIEQALELTTDGIEFYPDPSREDLRLGGRIFTADYAHPESIKKVLSAHQRDAELEITWKTSEDARTHQFYIEGVTQKEDPCKVILKVNGKAIDVDHQQTLEADVPAKGEFRVLSTQVIQAPEQHLLIRFSEPLDPSQNLRGLISSSDIDLRITTDGNLARVYPAERLAGTYNFQVSEGIRSMHRNKLETGSALSATFEVMKPQVRLVGKGVIIPSSDGLYFPFQAVSLRAVDVSIVRIFEKNIPQFLQTNDLTGSSELRRVGRRILKKTILLDQAGTVDFNSWNTYHIDLAELIKAEPGAIYQVEIDFNIRYSTYHCNGITTNEPIEIIEERYDPADDLEYEYYDWGDYNWRERDNPCHPTYYRNKSVSRNILASNLGMISKAGTDGSWMITVSDLNTSQPLQGVTVELLNYQQQIIATSATNNQGLAVFQLHEEKRPFLAIAHSGNQKGYLKLDRGSSLSLSAFDVSGVAVQQGLKGFIYGERGVWRPGDTLFLSFILEDRNQTLPNNHPVTFEVRNPRGTLIHRAVASLSKGGIYAFPVKTEPDAPTGNYTATARIGGVTFSDIFKVETVMPNRLKINLTLNQDAIRHRQPVTATFESHWLHGAPARNLKIQVDAILSEATTSFEEYPGFVFDDPARSFESEEITVYEGRLDVEGKTSFNPNISISSAAPGKLNAHFTARVFEEGGAFSIDRFTMPYYPYEVFTGLKVPDAQNRRGMGYLLTDTTHTIEFVTLTAEGKPVSGKRLSIEVYKIDWRWWWERHRENLSGYISSRYHRPLQQAFVTTGSNGKATWDLRINAPEWGRFLIRVVDDRGGHAAGTVIYMDWPGWISRDRETTPEAASMLAFATNKENYTVGENIHITIPSPNKGKIFLTVENGVKVLQTQWLDATAGETVHTIEATEEMTPNVFINAMLIQPHGQTANDLPLRMYGIAPIVVEDPQTHLHPEISMPEELEPEQKVTITVTEKDGKPMAFTLAMVDDGLLDLTRFSTPDPWQYFYAKEALGVMTWDMYDLVLGASSGRMQRILSIGGGDEVIDQGDQTANRFPPVVRYFGPFEVGRNKSRRIEFTMPNYVGSVRVMAVAARQGAYGSAEKTVKVKKPLMTLATLPRVLGPDEEVVMPVTVFAMDENIKNVKVRVEANDLFSFSGAKEQNLRFDQTGDQVLRFNMKTASRLGVATVRVIAESGKEKAVHDIELIVRNPNPPMTLVKDTILEKAATWKTNYTAFGMQGTNNALIELSTIPPVNLGKRLRFLIGYPHGCLEQTVSKAFPQLFISKLAEIDDETRQASEDNVRYALDRMHSFRTADGGLSLWPGGTYPDSWGTIYAGHFLLEAQKLGYSLPAGILDNWQRSTQRAARNWSENQRSAYSNNDLIQAYRLYVLALANTPEMGAMNRLRETANISVSARWRLAAAYVLAGNPEAARSLVEGVAKQVDPYREQAHTYGSHIRDMAMIVETLVLLNDHSNAMPLLRNLSQKLASDQWMSTQETAFSLVAFARFADTASGTTGVDANIGIHGRKAGKQISEKSLVQYPFEPVQSGQEQIEITNNGNGTLFARLITTGIPVAGLEQEQSNNLQLSVRFLLADGTQVQPEEIVQGTDFVADIRVTNPGVRGNLEQLILSFIVPSGWEIRTSRLDEGEEALESSPFQYQDIRDDRIYTYFDLTRGTTKNFRIRLHAAYEGRFYLPGTSCEAMYDNTINARTKGDWVEVALP